MIPERSGVTAGEGDGAACGWRLRLSSRGGRAARCSTGGRSAGSGMFGAGWSGTMALTAASCRGLAGSAAAAAASFSSSGSLTISKLAGT